MFKQIDSSKLPVESRLKPGVKFGISCVYKGSSWTRGHGIVAEKAVVVVEDETEAVAVVVAKCKDHMRELALQIMPSCGE